MKAMIETREPAIRPVAAAKPVARPVQSLRLAGIQPTAAPALFHAWRA